MTSYRIKPLAECHREMFGDLVLTSMTPIRDVLPRHIIQPIPYEIGIRRSSMDSLPVVQYCAESDKRRASDLVEQLLMDIYNSVHPTTTDYNSTSGKSHKSSWVEIVNLQEKDIVELISILECLKNYVERMGSVLIRQLKRRDALRRQSDAYCDVITKQLIKRVPQGNPSEDMRFTIQPLPGDTGFSQWVTAMKMVAQLPGGIPPEFRRRLWLTLADKHLLAREVDWPKVERTCFSEWSHPSDAELGVQIVKDLHRTGCSLFCGEDGQENQVLLKRVLLAYARWNKAVGYCQGFNMLAALILQVTDKSESDALKLMIYLIEGVLPDSYFADSLRGLSVDMAVFRELLRARFPRLSKHLDNLQNAAKDGSRSYEPPLTNVFTMQWFLTLFCNCLPQPTVLRVWDLIFLEGNEILLRTALAIWQVLAERILTVRSADEFYCMMGVFTSELLESELVSGNALIKSVVAIGNLTELNTLREHYLYNINPWGTNLPQVVDKQLKLYPKQSIALDISGLKKQYAKLKQRQRQAHIIFSAAISRQPTPTPPVTMNHLLLGKSALVPAKRIGPPKGSIPPARQATPTTLHWKDAPKQTSSSSSSDTELCDEKDDTSDDDDNGQLENIPYESDINLMKNDNTSATVDVETVSTPSKNINSATVSDTEDNLIVFKSESDEDSFDFEQFLSDRLKDNNSIKEKIDSTGRNSTRALQIIQENSLILHRILQCQSRLSPSPPMPLETVQSTLLQDETTCYNTYSFSDNTASFEPDESVDNVELINTRQKQTEELKSPEYGSKYSSILEKSRSLDEKYKKLILNTPMSRTFEEISTDTVHDSKTVEYEQVSPNFSTFQLNLPKSNISENILNTTSRNFENLLDPKESIGRDPLTEDTISSTTSLAETSSYTLKESVDNSSARYEVSVETEGSFTERIHVSDENEKFKTSCDTGDTNTDRGEYKIRSEGSDSSIIIKRGCYIEQDKNTDNAECYKFSSRLLGDTSVLHEQSPNYSSSRSPLRQSPSTTCYSFLTVDEQDKSSDNTPGDSCDISGQKISSIDIVPHTSSSTKFPLSPTLMSPSKSPYRSPSSPTKTFNPFPVPLNSRQNKEVPFKLGLYKH